MWGNTCCILTPTKNNNLSYKGHQYIIELVRIHIQGIDGDDPKTKENKTIVTTWHSSKGLEYDYSIVFVNDQENRYMWQSLAAKKDW